MRKLWLRSLLLYTSAALLGSSCAVVGNVKPVDEKSSSYGVANLSQEKPAVWMVIEGSTATASPAGPTANSSDISDVVYQNRQTSATISLNSACRTNPDTQSLKELTQVLLLGISDITLREEGQTVVQNSPALVTTVVGRMEDTPIMLRTVVLRHGLCVYDLVYLTPPEHYREHEADFAHFVASLHLKE